LLAEILEAIQRIEQYTTALTFEQFSANAEKQDAVLRRLTIIGEAVKGLPTELRERHPSVRWKEIAGARDMLVHEYFRADLELTWEMVREDLPELASHIHDVMHAEGLDVEDSL
jgi:uncharacterized protein with HEPN domain